MNRPPLVDVADCTCGNEDIELSDGTVSRGDSRDEDIDGTFVQCTDCGREVFGLDEADAVAMWNAAMGRA